MNNPQWLERVPMVPKTFEPLKFYRKWIDTDQKTASKKCLLPPKCYIQNISPLKNIYSLIYLKEQTNTPQKDPVQILKNPFFFSLNINTDSWRFTNHLQHIIYK